MEPLYHSQRPLSRDNLEGQTAIDLAVISQNATELVDSAKEVGGGVVRSLLIGMVVYPLLLLSPFTIFVAIHTGYKRWESWAFWSTIALAIAILVAGRVVSSVVDKVVGMVKVYTGIVDKIVTAILSAKASEGRPFDVTITEVAEDV